MTRFEAYVVEATRLKHLYAPQIKLLVGLETENFRSDDFISGGVCPLTRPISGTLGFVGLTMEVLLPPHSHNRGPVRVLNLSGAFR